MNTLVRLNKRLDSSNSIFSNQLDELLSGFLRPLPGDTRSAVAPIKIEVSEDATAYLVSAIIPGVRKEDIHIEVDQKEVSIVAEIKREAAVPVAGAESADKDATKVTAQLLHSERYYGKTSRVFSVAQDIDEAAVEAKYVDGVLSLILPKKVPVSAKRVTVQ
jgi:HSP20 family protein